MVNSALWRLTRTIRLAGREVGTTRKLRRGLLDLPAVAVSRSFRSCRDQKQMPLLYAYSPAVLPRPADWPERIHVTGYWFARSAAGLGVRRLSLVSFLEKRAASSLCRIRKHDGR